MSFVYAVRSNFTQPDLEAAWHAWYSGPKLAEMMTHPHFLSGQRYEAVGLDQTIRYLALWVVDSPGAFTSAPYKASWGWAEWKPHISHWSRNLYDAGDRDMTALLDVPTGGGLYLAAFDDVPEVDTEQLQATAARRRRPRDHLPAPHRPPSRDAALARHARAQALAPRVVSQFEPGLLRRECAPRPVSPARATLGHDPGGV
jgi:hypothetical protein